MMKASPILERLRKLSVIDENGCWLWTKRLDRDGYGRITYRGRARAAHIVSFEEHEGPVPEGEELDHACNVRRCINPQHLVPCTHRENVLRSSTNPCALNARKLTCIRGHAFTPENTRQDGPRRRCKTCVKINAARRYHSRKAMVAATELQVAA